MKKIVLNLIVILMTCMSFVSCAYERVDAGCEGIYVNLYGDDKGVGEVSLCTGAVWYCPFTHDVFEYPTYIQTVDYPSFEVNSKDGTKFTVDPAVLVKIEDGKSPLIFKKYRKQLDEIVKNTLYVYIRDAARIEFNKYTADQIVSNREAVDKSFEERVRKGFASEHFILQQLTPGIGYPKSYEEAINAKNKAIQDEMRVSNEIRVAEAEAKKKLVLAEAEAKANKLKEQSLTPLLIQKMAIEKWSGNLPDTYVGSHGIPNLILGK